MAERRRLLSLKSQITIVALIVWGLLSVYTNSILWAHIDETLPGNYQVPAKIGLLFFDVITLALLLWKIFVKDPLMSNWSLIGEILLVTSAIIHVAGVAQFENTRGQATANLKLAAEIQAETAKKQIEGITAGAKNMGSINEYQAKVFAREAMKQQQRAQAENLSKLTEKATAVQGETFLPAWWLKGPMYAFMPGLAMIIFFITLFIATGAIADEDGDGIPDIFQGKGKKADPAPAGGPIPATAHSTTIQGFNRSGTAPNYNISSQAPPDPKA